MTNEYCLPEHWKKWELEEILGAGAYGTVFRAGNVDDPEQFAAIKIIPIPKDSAEASALYREYGSMEEVSGYYSQIVTELVNEIQTLMSLKGCNNIVQIEDYHVEKSKENEYGWTIYIRMELLVSLQEYLQTHEASEELAIKVGLDVCDALIECEKAKIIHRDIKPDNILVSEEEVFKLGDFGVAKRLTGTESSFSVKGTFSYMSPEVYYGRPYDHTADIYSLGIVLFKLLNHNRDPFIDVSKQLVNHRDKENAMGKRMSGKPIPSPAYASEGMSKIIQKACAFLPEDRYQSAAELKGALESLKTEEVSEESSCLDEHKQKETVTKTGIREKKPVRKESKSHWIKIILAGLLLTLMGIFSGSKITSQKQLNENEQENLILDHVSCSPTGDAVCVLADKGVLTISGHGDVLYTNNAGAYPWDKNKDDIKEIIVEEGIESIGFSAFSDCRYLSKIKLPEGLKKIDESAFSNCELLTEIDHIPSTLIEIGREAFEDTRWIVDQKDENGFVIINDIIIKYYGDAHLLELPKHIKVIGYSAFENTVSLKKVVLPENLQAIKDDAFNGCISLNLVDNLEGNTSIIEVGSDVFENTPWLSIQIARGQGYAIVDGRLYYYADNKEDIIIPDEVREILGCSFKNNESVRKITVRNNVKSIASSAFYNCPHLKECILETTSVEEIFERTFEDCSSLLEISIPDNVKKIQADAFCNCSSLKKVKLPIQLEEIDDTAFYNCWNIEKVENAGVLDKKKIEDVFGGTLWYENDYKKSMK